jgi:Domain of unknown function (DUF4157)
MDRNPQSEQPAPLLANGRAIVWNPPDFGEPLDAPTRAYFEPRLGVDLGLVRVHQGAWADSAAQGLGAHAFAVGRDLVFAHDEYAPHTAAGRRLLAHELIHAAQQRGLAASPGDWLPVGRTGDPLEEEAHALAERLARGQATGRTSRERSAVIRRAVKLDTSSLKLEITKPGAVAAVHVGAKAALLHCTLGVNKGVADAPAPGRKVTLGNAILYKAALTAEGDFTELVTDFTFKFLQFSDVIVQEYLYAGRLNHEGSLRVNLKLGYTAIPCLDADENGADMPFIATNVSIKPRPGAAGVFDIVCEGGDNPHDMPMLSQINNRTKAPNFLFSARRDEGMIVVLQVTDKAGAVTRLAHNSWHVIWHSEFDWKSPAEKPVAQAKDARIDVGQSVLGAPTDSRLAGLLANPRGPTANEQDAQANIEAFTNFKDPVIKQLSQHEPEIPQGWMGVRPATSPGPPVR